MVVFTLITDGDFLPRESALSTLGEGVRFVHFLFNCVALETGTIGPEAVDPSVEDKFEKIFSEAISATMDSVSKYDDEFNCVGVEDFTGSVSIHSVEVEAFDVTNSKDRF